jgi:hypothetical protein
MFKSLSEFWFSRRRKSSRWGFGSLVTIAVVLLAVEEEGWERDDVPRFSRHEYERW